MNYIRELYAGNLGSSSHRITSGSEYSKLIQQMSDIHDKLSEKLSDENKELLERMSELQGNIEYISSVDNYALGFRDGSRLMIDILLGRNENINNN